MKRSASFAIEAKGFIDCKGEMLHFCFMETENEVQANLKIPKSLKEKLKSAAKDNHRSMTAEVVARLQESFSTEVPTQELIPASEAKELSVAARKNASEIIRKRILDGLSQAVAKGHSTAYVDFRDLELELIPQADQDALIDHFSDWLEGAGYEVDWDGSATLLIQFDDL